MNRIEEKRKAKPEVGSTPKWALTYGDMMSLLLTFFIAVVSFSTIQVEKYRAAMGSFRGALQTPFTRSRAALEPLNPPIASPQAIAETAEKIEGIAQRAGFTTGVELLTSPEGLRIILTDTITFDEGSDELKTSAIQFLRRLAQMPLMAQAYGVIIEGHTDDTPIHTTRFPSNWELSTARSLSVLKLFQNEGIAPQKLIAIGYGEYRPRVPLPRSASKEEKRVNRRVEIFIKTSPSNTLPLPQIFRGTSESEDDHYLGDDQNRLPREIQ
ncbi:MAG: flagellar motor protein MotB [bacterium]